MATAVFATAELAARFFCGPYQRLWAYWTPEAGANLEAFRQHVQNGGRLDLLVVGDSTAQSNFSYEVFRNGLQGPSEVWNIGTPGAFAEASRWTLLPLLGACECRPRVLVTSFLPEAFSEAPAVRYLEARILESPAGRMARGKSHLGKYLALARLWPVLRVWKAEREGKVAAVIQQRGFLARQRVVDLLREPPESGAYYPLVLERLRLLDRLAAWAQANHVQLIVVIPPRLHPSAHARQYEEAYRRYLEQLSRSFPLVLLDTTGYSWPVEQFADRNHLNAEGAARLSSLLVRRLAQTPRWSIDGPNPQVSRGISDRSSPFDHARRGTAQ
ncbi:MAG: hypothetical protein KatS3mg110_4616 [Pirellulaceae bacterium]|nr:MAG: hypothetical protein KatS3mg110_4616 [Pirellulaceae bacterium]